MGLINMFRSSGQGAPADPRNEKVINDVPYDAHPAAAHSPAAFGPEAEIPEEIKHRQIALVVKYVMAMRAR
jgi:hypothetical protein